MRGLSAEQLLIIADEVCAVHKVSVVSFAALSAASGVSGASLHGVDVHGSVEEMAHAVARTITRLGPLSGANDVFAEVTARVLLSLNS
ncbi:TetR family transcriptional regulator [Corynebacterium pacaense]|uniref:TetR family transcriptional regulator n=1 Tax=Corynebacterium pacaense TaxID=1816684 RepID=UPI0009BAFEBC|nr:TetR family transcriptional regulator [Corynebacterium pacaense]